MPAFRLIFWAQAPGGKCMNEHSKNLLQIHSAVLLFGFTGLFGKYVALPAQYIVLGRVFFATAAMSLYFFFAGKNVRLNSVKDYLTVCFTGVILAFHWTAFYSSVQSSTVAIALLTFSAYPIFVTFIEPFVFHEKLKKRDILFAVLIFCGVLLIIPDFNMKNSYFTGLLWGMTGSFSFAVMSMLNRLFASKHSGAVVAFYEQGTATLVLLPLLFLPHPAPTGRDLLLIAVLGVVFTGLAHSLFIQGMKNVRAQTAGLIAGLESVYGIIAAAVLLSEIPSARELIGGALILGTAFVSTVLSDK